MSLCTQANVEDTLQISFTNDPEGTVTYLIEGASQAIKTWLGRELEEATYTNEIYDGVWGRGLIRLQQYPVTAVSAVVENSVALTESDDYEWYEDGRLVRVSGNRERRWIVGRKMIDVTYTAGYATIPDDIRNICAGIVARYFRAGADYAATPAATGAIKSVSLEGSDSIEYAADPMLASVGHVAMLTMQDKQDLSGYQKRLTL